jgi:hypothetical protein
VPSPRIALIATSATLAVVLAGCATTGTVSTTGLTGPQKDVATTIANLQSDAQANSASKICQNDFARNVVQALSIGGRRCESVISDQLKVVDNFNLSLLNNHAIKVNGNTATALVQDTQAGKTTHVDTLTLVKEGQAWKISRVG